MSDFLDLIRTLLELAGLAGDLARPRAVDGVTGTGGEALPVETVATASGLNSVVAGVDR